MVKRTTRFSFSRKFMSIWQASAGGVISPTFFFRSSASWKFLFSWSVNFLLISGLLVFFLSIFAFLLDLRRYWRPLSLCIQIIEFLGNCESFFGFIQSLSRIA